MFSCQNQIYDKGEGDRHDYCFLPFQKIIIWKKAGQEYLTMTINTDDTRNLNASRHASVGL